MVISRIVILTTINRSGNPPSPDKNISMIKINFFYSGIRFHSDPELRNIENIAMREIAEDEPQMFNEKEKRVRDVLLKSTHDTRNRRTFSEMLPILRSLSKQQRLTLAALITAQTNIKSGESLDLKQVCKNKKYISKFSISFYNEKK